MESPTWNCCSPHRFLLQNVFTRVPHRTSLKQAAHPWIINTNAIQHQIQLIADSLGISACFLLSNHDLEYCLWRQKKNHSDGLASDVFATRSDSELFTCFLNHPSSYKINFLVLSLHKCPSYKRKATFLETMTQTTLISQVKFQFLFPQILWRKEDACDKRDFFLLRNREMLRNPPRETVIPLCVVWNDRMKYEYERKLSFSLLFCDPMLLSTARGIFFLIYLSITQWPTGYKYWTS